MCVRRVTCIRGTGRVPCLIGRGTKWCGERFIIAGPVIHLQQQYVPCGFLYENVPERCRPQGLLKIVADVFC